MNIKTLFSNAPITTLFIGTFIALFIIQIVSGVNINEPSSHHLIAWGANVLPLTMHEDPWRLISSAFLHIGIMHLLFNTFAMYYFGQVAEIIVGSTTLALLFIFSAIGGNLLNCYVTWWQISHGTGLSSIAAGASGGIMGIGGALLVFALFKKPSSGLVLNRRSLVLIMGINLAYGFAVPGIDNAGHIGGALTGVVIALAYVFIPSVSHRSQWATAPTVNHTSVKNNAFKIIFLVISVLFAVLWLYLHQLLTPYLEVRSPSAQLAHSFFVF